MKVNFVKEETLRKRSAKIIIYEILKYIRYRVKLLPERIFFPGRGNGGLLVLNRVIRKVVASLKT